jgi:DNA-binding NarL/FixJ family response regulator/AraC-like DNA-binding protein
MFRVFVADDELPIIQWLQSAVNWNSLGLSLVGSATDGVAALQAIERLLPDIVIIDVRMPGLSGLDVIDSIHRLRPDLQFVILSGYPSFEYAQRAVGLRAAGYLVKPIDEADLAAVLNPVVEELKKKRRGDRQLTTLKSNLQALAPIARQQVIREWLLEPEDPMKYWPHPLRFSGLKALPVILVLFYGRSDLPAAFLTTLKHFAEPLFPPTAVFTDCVVHAAYALLVQPSAHGELVRKLHGFRRAVIKETGLPVEFSVSGPGVFADAPQMLQSALKDAGVIDKQDGATDADDRTEVGGGPADTVRKIVQEVWHRWMRPNTISQNPLVEQMLVATSVHLANPNLSLKWLSQNVVFGSPDYLSKLFVRVTGLHFSSYVTSFRIEVAKELLRRGEPDTIAEVAQAVGYDENAQYFSHVFRRAIGVSPTDYRAAGRSRHPGIGPRLR